MLKILSLREELKLLGERAKKKAFLNKKKPN